MARIANLKIGNSQRLWKLLGPSLYSHSPLLPVTGRELLQNAADSQRQRGVDTPIRFSLTKDVEGNWTLVCSDSGIGMDEDTIVDKFLALGESGKTDAADVTGGFGVAKASIIGACTNWGLRTRDNVLSSQMLGGEVGRGEHFDGAEITLSYSKDEDTRGLRPDWCSANSMIWYLVTSVVPVTLAVRCGTTEALIESSGIKVTDNLKLAEFVTADGKTTVRLYQVPMSKVETVEFYSTGYKTTNNLRSRIIVRLNGLTQFIMSANTSYNAEFNVVADVTTTAQPGECGYPFTASREQVDKEIHNKICALTDTLFANFLSSMSDLNERMGKKRTLKKFLGGNERQPRRASVCSQTKAQARREEREAKAEDATQEVAAALTDMLKDAPLVQTERVDADPVRPRDVNAVTMTMDRLAAPELLIETRHLEMSPTGVKTLVKWLEGQKVVSLARDCNIRMLKVWSDMIELIMADNPKVAHGFGIGIIMDSDFGAQRHEENGTVYYLFNCREVKISDAMNTVMRMFHMAVHEVTHTEHSGHTEAFTSCYHDLYNRFFEKRGMKAIYALARQLRGTHESEEIETEVPAAS